MAVWCHVLPRFSSERCVYGVVSRQEVNKNTFRLASQAQLSNTTPSSECHYLLHRLPPQKTTNYKDTYEQLPPSFVFLINQVGRKINCLWADVEKVMISWELSRLVGSCRKYSILKALTYLTQTDHAMPRYMYHQTFLRAKSLAKWWFLMYLLKTPPPHPTSTPILTFYYFCCLRLFNRR